MLTKKQAKEESILLWTYIRDHPDEIRREDDKFIAAENTGLDHVKEYICVCPLCELFWKGNRHDGCPLNSENHNCMGDGEPYGDWVDYSSSENAERVLNKIKDWEV